MAKMILSDYERARLSYSMGFESWALLLVTLEKHRDNVVRQFNYVVSDSESNNENIPCFSTLNPYGRPYVVEF